jgi:hypothetical protein
MIIERALLSGLAVVGLAAGIAVAPQPASASTDGLPDGSWRQTCDRAYVQDGTLHAACRRDGGNSGNSGSMGQWSGSFRDSCRDISADSNGTLVARQRQAPSAASRSISQNDATAPIA